MSGGGTIAHPAGRRGWTRRRRRVRSSGTRWKILTASDRGEVALNRWVNQRFRRDRGITPAMTRWSFIPLFSLLVAATAFAGEGAVSATQPAKALEAYRYLDVGSWITTEAHVRTNGAPATIKRKVQVTVEPATGCRAVQESRWSADAFEPTGPVQLLAHPDRRSFDEVGLTPHTTQPDQILTIGHKRYVCTVGSYLFASEADGRSTLLTLWRDKSGSTQLPPRTMSINNHEVPLPQDALQADFAVD